MMLAALALCIFNMLAVQVHREIGHAAPIASTNAAQSARASGQTPVLAGHCQLCDFGFQPESAPSLPFPLPVDRTTVRVRHDDVPPGFLRIASAGHIWRSRAPPGIRTSIA